MIKYAYMKKIILNQNINIDKIYLYQKNHFEPKYQLLINKREQNSIKHFKVTKVFIEYSIDVKDVYPNVDE